MGIRDLVAEAKGIILRASAPNYDVVNTIADASITLLSAHFEGFLRDLGEDYSKILVKKKIGFRNLPDQIQKAHLRHTPKWIDRKRQLITDRDLEDIARRYGSPFDPKSGRYELVYESYGDCLGNPNCENVREAFSRMGIPIVNLAKRSKNPSVATYQEWLDVFNRLRNSIAHGEVGRTPTTLGDVEKYIGDFGELATFMEDVANRSLNRMKKK